MNKLVLGSLTLEQFENKIETFIQENEHLTKLHVDQDNVSDIKKLRAEKRKQFTEEFESLRKEFKEITERPYKQLLTKYEPLKSFFNELDSSLKNGIDEVEQLQKDAKEEEVFFLFEELVTKHELDFLEFSKVGLNITLSASLKSLKEQTQNFIDKVVSDIETIKTLEHSTRVLVEYQKSLDLNGSIQSVNNAIEREKEIESVKTHEQPVIVDDKPKKVVVEEIVTVSFKITDTITKARMVKQFMIDNDIKFEGV